MQCTTHSEILALGTCTYSGKPYCGDCLVEVEGRSVGKPFLDRAVADIRDRAKSGSQPNVYMNAGGGGGSAAAQSVSPAVPMTSVIVTLNDVPFYRRRWFLVLMLLTFSPVAFLSAISGPLYWHDEDGWRRVSGAGKATYIILSLWFGALIISHL